MNFKHSFNNGSGNKPESNQQQTSLKQGNNFNVSQQNYQQNGPNQNYNQLSTNQGAQSAPQYQQQNGKSTIFS